MHALRMEPRLCCLRTQGLIHQRYRQSKTTFQALRKAPRETADFVGAAVRVMRLTDDELNRLPFGEQCFDGGEARFIVSGVYGGERVCDAHGQVGHGHTDAFFAEIEGQHGCAGSAFGVRSQEFAIKS